MKKILICEDEKDAQQALQNMLAKRKYEVITADNGQEAIAKVKELKPDLVVLDIRMPKVDGLEVAREIRDSDKATKIVFVTAFASPQIEKEAGHYNISAYIVKPASPEAIIKSIETALA